MFYLISKNSLVIHEGNTKQISTMTVTLYLMKLIDVRKILYKILMNMGFYKKLSSLFCFFVKKTSFCQLKKTVLLFQQNVLGRVQLPL